jgi:hypothetical protein
MEYSSFAFVSAAFASSIPSAMRSANSLADSRVEPGFRKVYPMTLTEQTEMDTFLEEALATGHIRQSKSPLGAPVFFIKKKDGKLRFVQDY